MVTISNQKQVGKRELFTVEIGGVQIHDCVVAEGKNGPFITGPSRSFVAKDGTTKWVNLATFSRDIQHEIMEVLRGGALPEIDVDKEGIDTGDIPF